MNQYSMRDIIPLLGIPSPPQSRTDYNVPCPVCDTGRGKHLNIHLVKNVYRCPRCDFSGGVFDLYAHMTGCDRKKVRDELKRLVGHDVGAPVRTAAHKLKPPKKEQESSVPDTYSPTDIEARDRTYRELLSMLPLFDEHEQNLLSRGLDHAAISRFGYKSVPLVGHDMLAKKLLTKGCYLSGIPGFHRNDSGDWTMLKGKPGIMIPVRDRQNRIQGIKIRLDNATRRKFRWWSSRAYKDGCGCENWVHVAGPIREEILLIEGPMKADIVHHLTGQTVIAVPGVNSLLVLEEILEELRELGVRKIMTALDMDYLNKWTVQKGYWNLVCLLEKLGLEFGTYLWLPDYNGLDDYIWEYLMNGRMAA